MKYGSGTLILSGTNTFSGDTIIHAGTLMLSSSQALAGSTFDTTSTGALSFGALTGATFGALKNSGNAVLSNTAGAAVTLVLGRNGLGNAAVVIVVKTTFGQGLQGARQRRVAP